MAEKLANVLRDQQAIQSDRFLATDMAGDFAGVGNLSTSQLIAALAPGARVVKALNTMLVSYLEAEPIVNGARRVAFISADDGAKKEIGTLLEGFGYSVIDLGNLRDGG